MERKEAIEVIKKNWPDSSFTMLREALETLIPELKESKESDDERIKKAIKYGLDYVFTNNTTIYETTKEQCLFWLEKQGKKKSIWHNEDEEPQRGSLILLIMQSGNPIVAKIIEPNHTFNHGERWAYIDDLLDKQGEQKPAWSEEDETALGDALWCCEQAASIAKNENDMGNIWYAENWLKSLKDRVQPQTTWKPSDEQITWLYRAADDAGEGSRMGKILNELLSDLKKLREE